MTRRCGSWTGSVRRTTLLTSVNIAVLAPMPSASDSTATAVTAGVAARARTARRRSCITRPPGCLRHARRRLRRRPLVLPVQRLAGGEPFDRLCDTALAGGVGLRLGDPLEILALVARAERVEGCLRRGDLLQRGGEVGRDPDRFRCGDFSRPRGGHAF